VQGYRMISDIEKMPLVRVRYVVHNHSTDIELLCFLSFIRVGRLGYQQKGKQE
jgi:hypothetical protein